MQLQQRDFFHIEKMVVVILTYLKAQHISFEDRMEMIFGLSKKLFSDGELGIYHKSGISVLISPEVEGVEYIILSKEKDDRKDINPEVAYKQASEAYIGEVEKSEGHDVADLIRPIEWRYTDTNETYANVIIQVIEEYMVGRVPHETSIMDISKEGKLQSKAFFLLDRMDRETYKKIGGKKETEVSYEDFRF